MLFKVVAAGISADDPSIRSGENLDAALARYVVLGTREKFFDFRMRLNFGWNEWFGRT